MGDSPRRSKKKPHNEVTSEILDLNSELSEEQEDFYNKVNELAVTMDGIISMAQVPNLVAVNALSILLRHAAAQMYSSAYGLPDMHEAIAEDIEPDFFDLMNLVSRKADFMIKAKLLQSRLEKTQLPN